MKKLKCENVLYILKLDNVETPITCDYIYTYGILNKINIVCDNCNMKYKGVEK